MSLDQLDRNWVMDYVFGIYQWYSFRGLYVIVVNYYTQVDSYYGCRVDGQQCLGNNNFQDKGTYIFQKVVIVDKEPGKCEGCRMLQVY